MEEPTISSIQGYEYLWNGEESDWILYRTAASDIPMIFNQITRMALVIEDVEEWRSLVAAMIDHGAVVLDKFPAENG